MATKKTAAATPKAQQPHVYYTLRRVPRETWNAFRDRLKGEGHTVAWAFTRFIEKYGNGDKVF